MGPRRAQGVEQRPGGRKPHPRRAEAVQRHRAGETSNDIARDLGVQPDTVKRWAWDDKSKPEDQRGAGPKAAG